MSESLTDSLGESLTSAAEVHAAQKDVSAFDVLYRQYVQAVYRYLYSRVGNAKDAEDLTAQTFLAALEAFPRYRHKGRFAAWLFSIARNKAADHFRRSGQESTLEQVENIATGKDPLQQALASERIAALRQLVERLPEEERELLRLRYVAELPFAEIAALLGRKTDAVKKSLYRLLARMQSQLENHDE